MPKHGLIVPTKQFNSFKNKLYNLKMKKKDYKTKKKSIKKILPKHRIL